MNAENQPTLRIHSPFWLGNHYTRINDGTYYEGYNYVFGTDVGPYSLRFRDQNLNSIGVFLERYPDANIKDSSEHRRGNYRFYEEGTFDIGWNMNAEVKERGMLVSYSVTLARPDLSLRYVLIEEQQAEFFSETMGHRKMRTRIDGLPVYLRINGWQNRGAFGEGLPTSVTLFRTGVGEQFIPFEVGAQGLLQHQERLEGVWDENWQFHQGEFISCSVDLRGSWRR